MTREGEPFVSIIVPAYNEAHRLEASIRDLNKYLRSKSWSCEFLLVVEKSTDGTLELAKRLANEHPLTNVIGNDVQRGKGYAVRTGMLRARGEIALFMDADLSTSLAEIDRFLERLAEKPEIDVLVGNRAHYQSKVLMSQGFLRKTMGQTFNAILRLITGIQIRDTQCGFKAFRRKACVSIFQVQKLDGFAFDVEAILLAMKMGFKVADMPVEWTNASGTKVRIIRDSFRMLCDAFRVRYLVK